MAHSLVKVSYLSVTLLKPNFAYCIFYTHNSIFVSHTNSTFFSNFIFCLISDCCLVLYSREDKNPMTVKFTNRTGKKIKLFWINKKGRRKRKGKLKDGQSKAVDTYETHVFMAFNKKLCREPLLINGSPVFYAFPHKHGDNHLEVEIKKPLGMMETVTCLLLSCVHV